MLLCMLLLFGCGKGPKQQAEDEAEIHIKRKISEVILQFAAAHGASINWIGKIDKLWERDSIFTAHFQRIFLDSQESAFLFPLEIADIVRKDGSYMLAADLSYNVYTPVYDVVLMLDCPPDIADLILDDETGSLGNFSINGYKSKSLTTNGQG